MRTTMTIETTNTAEQTQDTDSLRTETVKLVEMGDASVETKGTVSGVEYGFTPLAH
jgi:hypothetical protein